MIPRSYHSCQPEVASFSAALGLCRPLAENDVLIRGWQREFAVRQTWLDAINTSFSTRGLQGFRTGGVSFSMISAVENSHLVVCLMDLAPQPASADADRGYPLVARAARDRTERVHLLMREAQRKQRECSFLTRERGDGEATSYAQRSTE